MKNKGRVNIRIFNEKKQVDEETDKEKLRKEIADQTEKFLKRGKIEKIPRGLSKELIGLNKKQKQRFANKQSPEDQTILEE